MILKEKLFLCLTAIIWSIHANCQDTILINKPADALNYLNKIYQSNSLFLNGILVLENYKRDLGHPFFGTDNFIVGSITIDQIVYTNVLLRYNIYEQNIQIEQPLPDKKEVLFIPDNHFISDFTIGDKKFEKFNSPNRHESFYQVIYDGELKCLYEWNKIRSDYLQNINHKGFKYVNSGLKKYLNMNDRMERYKGKGSFLRLFPADQRKHIALFIKENNISVKKSSDMVISKLMAFCEINMRELQK